MKDGYGAPFVKLFNSDGEQIEAFKEVERFTYIESIKVDDSSTITLRGVTADLVDVPDLMIGRKVQFIFGYTSGVTSDKIDLWIFDRKPVFDEQGVKLTLVLYAKAAYMRLNSDDTVRDNYDVTQLIEDSAAKWNLEVDSEISLEGGIYDNIDDLEKHISPLSDAQLEEQDISIIVEDITSNNTEFGDFTNNPENFQPDVTTTKNDTQVKYKIKKWSSKAQSKRSDMAEIQDMLESQEGGPWQVSGKDNRLLITRRDFSKQPLKSLHWLAASGRILSFAPQERNRDKAKGGLNMAFNQWDDEEKLYMNGISDGVDANTVMLADRVPQDFLPEDELINKLARLQLTDEELDALNFVVQPEESVKAGFEFTTIESDVGITGRSLVLATNVPDDVQVKIKYKAFVKDKIDPVDNNLADASIFADNLRRENSLKLLIASCSIIGDPLIVSNNVIEMVGVGTIYSGNWFLDSVTHNLSSGDSFKTTLELVRNASGKTDDKKNLTKIDAVNFGLKVNKQIAKQDNNEEDDPTRTID